MTSPSISIAVERRRVERVTGLGTTGTLLDQTVQEDGWLDLVTSSSESLAIEGCANGEALCSDECVDVSSDDANCGECGNDCDAADSCINATCSGPTACGACIEAGPAACADEIAACDANPDCVSLRNCIAPCTTQQCINDCVDANPDGLDDLQSENFCMCTPEACGAECFEAC